MTDEMKMILDLMNSVITGNRKNYMEYESVDWNDVFDIVCRNNIAPTLFSEVSYINTITPVDSDVMKKWKSYALYTSLSEYRRIYGLKQILKKTEEEGVVLIIFKGPILADLYPNYALRVSCDTDILINECDKEKIFRIIKDLGYERVMESEGNVYTFFSTEYNHKLELHTSLYAIHKGPRIDYLKSIDLANKEKLVRLDACSILLTTLGYEEQLVYLMFHLFKHFILEGILLRHLIDIVLFINKYLDQISIIKFWNIMEELGYSSGCEVLFSVGIRYLGLNPKILRDVTLSDPKVCDDFLMDVFNFGLYKGENRQGFQLAGNMWKYMVGEETKQQSKKNMYLRLLKPINKKYEYARKNKILLPVCWGHKLISYIYSKYILNKGLYTPSEMAKATENRVQLLEEIGLINKQ